MNKSWVLIPIGALTILLVFLIYAFVDHNPSTIYETNDAHDAYMNTIGLDPTQFTPYQKQVIYESDDISYVEALHEEPYSGISVEPIVFERSWGSGIRPNWDESLNLDFDVHLFEREYSYLAIMTFTLPYAYQNERLVMGYIDFRYSNNFDITTSLRMSYVDDDKEYALYSTMVSKDSDFGMYPIYQNTQQINKLIKPRLIYTYIISINPTDDNDLDTDMYLGMDIDVYMHGINTTASVQLGFNEFKLVDERYLVTRKSVQYRKETQA